jgi:hypothetical protein
MLDLKHYAGMIKTEVGDRPSEIRFARHRHEFHGVKRSERDRSRRLKQIEG